MVTMENKIRKLINEGTPMVNTRIWSPWGTTAESAAASGSFDYLEFLAEYVPYDMRELENLVRACENQGVGSMLKVDFQNRAYMAQKAMAMGFQAILFTDHQNAEQVKETIYLTTPDTP